MERKTFLRNSVGLFGTAVLLNSCKKTGTDSIDNGSGSCIVTPNEVEGPYPYPGGEINNPLNRSNVTDGQTGVRLVIEFSVVNTNKSCAAVPGARVDIWHCNKDGYYSGYGNQPGLLGNQSYVGQTWLRGYQLADNDGKANFETIYPGWYQGRATHIHIEVFVNNVLKKTTQITFPETISDAVHTSALYVSNGVNPIRNARDNIFGNSATDLANETVALSGSIAEGYSGSFTIGIAL